MFNKLRFYLILYLMKKGKKNNRKFFILFY